MPRSNGNCLDVEVCKAWPSIANKTLAPQLIKLWQEPEKESLEEHKQHGDIIFVYNQDHTVILFTSSKKHWIGWCKVKWRNGCSRQMMIRVDSVARYLQHLVPSIPTVVGRIVIGALVWKTGKWADGDYEPAK